MNRDFNQCCICLRACRGPEAHVINLTRDEQAYLKKSTGITTPASFIYCQPCWRVLSDPVTGIQFFTNHFQKLVKAMGVAKPEVHANAYRDRLYKLMRRNSN